MFPKHDVRQDPPNYAGSRRFAGVGLALPLLVGAALALVACGGGGGGSGNSSSSGGSTSSSSSSSSSSSGSTSSSSSSSSSSGGKSSSSSSSSSSSGSGGASTNCTGSMVVNSSGGGCVNLAVTPGELVNAKSLPVPAAAPATLNGVPVSYKQGFYSFEIQNIAVGAEVAVTVTTPPGLNPIAYVKCSSDQATCQPYENALISGNNIVLSLIDGGAGDDDAKANALILDPGAPVFAVPTTPLQQAKSLVQNIRNAVQTQLSLQQPLTAFANQVDATVTITQPQSASLFQTLGQASTEAVRYYKQLAAKGQTSGSETVNTVDSNFAPQSATVSIANGGGNLPTSTATVSGKWNNETINLSLVFTQNPQTTTASTITASIGASSSISTTSTGAGLKLAFSGGTVTVNKTNSSAIAANYSNVSSVSLSNLAATLSQQNLASGVSPASFTGTLNAAVVQCTAATCQSTLAQGRSQVFSPSSFDLKGTFAEGSATVSAELKASLTAAASFDPTQKITSSNVPAGTAEVTVSESGIANVPSTTVDVAANLTSYYRSGNNSAPIGNATLVFMQAGIKLLEAQVTTTTPASGTGDATINASFTDENGTVLSLAVNPSGVAGASGTTIGQATVGGTSVGTISKTAAGEIIITYTDGTFESIFN